MIFSNTRILFLILLLVVIRMGAQNTPLGCDYYAYLFQHNDVYAIDLASGSSFEIAKDITPGNINATGYNAKDGFIWGSLSSPEKTIARIDQDFLTTSYTFNELPQANRYIGDISPDGIYYLKPGGSTYYKIDLDPNSANYLTYLGSDNLSQNINIHDWAFNLIDGMLYTVEKTTNILYRINPNTSDVYAIGEVPILSGNNYTYGAVYFDNTGRFYISSNQTGTIYMIQDVQSLDNTSLIDSNLFAFGPSSSSNDGARCPAAEVPQENCTNGIDDDGDGLIDCDDPSCSGVASCPEIEAPVSGGNDGGLESNNRLSRIVNQRNFKRKSSGYSFKTELADRFVKPITYSQRNSANEIILNDFIPLDIIDEDEVINTTPSDLIDITNATEVLAADYLKSNKRIASLMLLKTENGVYEHSKYICDRLLGAELLHVSTLEINQKTFLKSIIKNTEGQLEFVSSFSARLVDNNQYFTTESHWVKDQYTENDDYYNVQIWADSMDNLLLLMEEILFLIDQQREIIDHNSSSPPPTFVKKGSYTNGKLILDIVNNNLTTNVFLSAGFRVTETSSFDSFNESVQLNEDYLTQINIDSGQIFDVGIRIENGVHTPDDLFLSDGAWGVDDFASSTINSFQVFQNDNSIGQDELRVERNPQLSAITSEYISLYKSFNAKFSPISLNEYNMLKFKASGSGKVEIRLIKEGIDNWNNQFLTSVILNENLNEFEIPLADFYNVINSNELVFDDVIAIVFTMYSNNGEEELKEITLSDVKFVEDAVLNVNDNLELLDKVFLYPNPMKDFSTISYMSSTSEELSVFIYNQIGQVVHHKKVMVSNGENRFIIKKKGLKSGLYFVELISSSFSSKVIKLMVK